jgi:hypothetical protein
MSVDLELEKLYGCVELVKGRGSVRSGKLCIMSFVAYLTGEIDTDMPVTASPLIRNFSIPLNDGAPHAWRQELKPFAPRIIGTNDGRDSVRATILARAIVSEVLPKMGGRSRLGSAYERACLSLTGMPASVPDVLWRLTGWGDEVARLTCNIAESYAKSDYPTLGTWAGRLFAARMTESRGLNSGRWYWSKALELLDRLCEVGAEERSGTIPAERVEQLQRRQVFRTKLPKLPRKVLEHIW